MDNIKVHEEAITETAQTVATSIAQAAKPGPVPTATGASPIDGAVASVAGAVAANVAASSAQLAPRSAEGLAKSEAALAQLNTQDSANAADIKTVPAEMHPQRRESVQGTVQPASFGQGDVPLTPPPPSVGVSASQQLENPC